jgi:hypothetical protein
MERIWKEGGLDLKLTCYCCLPTWEKEGLIQMVAGAQTICNIQMEACTNRGSFTNTSEYIFIS